MVALLENPRNATASSPSGRIIVDEAAVLEVSGDDRLESVRQLIMRGMKIRKFDPQCASRLHDLVALSLSHNALRDLKHFHHLVSLVELNLNFNAVTSLCGLACPGLQRLYLSNNLIPATTDLSRFSKLRTLCLFSNIIPDLGSTITTLRGLPNLRQLDLDGNPCSRSVGYRHRVIGSFMRLDALDGEELTQLDRELSAHFLEEQQNELREVATTARGRRREFRERFKARIRPTTAPGEMSMQDPWRPSPSEKVRFAESGISRGSPQVTVGETRLFSSDRLNRNPQLLSYLAQQVLEDPYSSPRDVVASMQCDISNPHSKHAENLRSSSCERTFKTRAPRPIVSADTRSIAVKTGHERTLADAGEATSAEIGVVAEKSRIFYEDCSDEDGGCVSQPPATVAECPAGFVEGVLVRAPSARSMNSTPSSSSRAFLCSYEADSSPPSRATENGRVVAADKPEVAEGVPPKSETNAEEGGDETRTQTGKASAGSSARMQAKKPSAPFPAPTRCHPTRPPPSKKPFSAKVDPSDPYTIIRNLLKLIETMQLQRTQGDVDDQNRSLRARHSGNNDGPDQDESRESSEGALGENGDTSAAYVSNEDVRRLRLENRNMQLLLMENRELRSEAREEAKERKREVDDLKGEVNRLREQIRRVSEELQETRKGKLCLEENIRRKKPGNVDKNFEGSTHHHRSSAVGSTGITRPIGSDSNSDRISPSTCPTQGIVDAADILIECDGIDSELAELFRRNEQTMGEIRRDLTLARLETEAPLAAKSVDAGRRSPNANNNGLPPAARATSAHVTSARGRVNGAADGQRQEESRMVDSGEVGGYSTISSPTVSSNARCADNDEQECDSPSIIQSLSSGDDETSPPSSDKRGSVPRAYICQTGVQTCNAIQNRGMNSQEEDCCRNSKCLSDIDALDERDRAPPADNNFERNGSEGHPRRGGSRVNDCDPASRFRLSEGSATASSEPPSVMELLSLVGQGSKGDDATRPPRTGVEDGSKHQAPCHGSPFETNGVRKNTQHIGLREKGQPSFLEQSCVEEGHIISAEGTGSAGARGEGRVTFLAPNAKAMLLEDDQ